MSLISVGQRVVLILLWVRVRVSVRVQPVGQRVVLIVDTLYSLHQSHLRA